MIRTSFLRSLNPIDCTGCALCSHVCPTSAIAMEENACGFLYPVVEHSKCIDCKKCFSVCHMHYSESIKNDKPRAFGAYVKNNDFLRRSASGGIATALCASTIKQGGVVYACVANRENVHHERLTTLDDLERARGSRYVQSNLSGIYTQLANDLKTAREVCFVGTPCQCAAIRSIADGCNNILLIDLICEGVPSRRMYADFLNDIEIERNETVTDFRFRDKRAGWPTKNAVVVGRKGVMIDARMSDYYYYYYLFLRALILRESCYACPYACDLRVGDVTVGDFWGIENLGLGYSVSEIRGGISTVLVNTKLGENAIEVLKDEIDLKACSLSAVKQSNNCLMHPSVCDKSARDAVISAYEAYGGLGMKAEYTKMFGRKAKIMANIKKSVPLLAKILAKRIRYALKKKNADYDRN